MLNLSSCSSQQCYRLDEDTLSKLHGHLELVGERLFDSHAEILLVLREIPCNKDDFYFCIDGVEHHKVTIENEWFYILCRENDKGKHENLLLEATYAFDWAKKNLPKGTYEDKFDCWQFHQEQCTKSS